MDIIATTLSNALRDGSSMLLALLVFLAVGTLAFAVMALVRARGAVKRRTMGIGDQEPTKSSRSLRYSSLKAITHLIEYTTKHYSGTNIDTMKVLRTRLIRAGIYDSRGIAFFFIARTAFAIGLAVAIFLLLPLIARYGGSFFWLMVIVGGI